MNSEKVFKFINRNLVAIIIIPTIISLHWGCIQIQNNAKLVKPEERKDLPILLAAKYAKNEVVNKMSVITGGREKE